MTTLKLVFLGTGGSWPTPERAVTANALKRGGEVLLFDCGEGTQRQLMRSSVSFMQISRIFVSHFHGDHFLGIPGLVQSMALNDRKEALEIYGPSGTVELVKGLLALGYFNPTFDVRVTDLKDGQRLEFDNYSVEARLADHSVPDLAFSFEEKPRPGKFDKPRALELGIPEGPLFAKLQRGESVEVNGATIPASEVLGPPRPGRKIVFSGDTRPSEAVAELSKGADVLVHEATLDHTREDKAEAFGHCSARQAAKLAKDAGVRLLLLTHISPRYKDPAPLLEEALELHPDVVIAEDFMEVDVGFGGHEVHRHEAETES